MLTHLQLHAEEYLLSGYIISILVFGISCLLHKNYKTEFIKMQAVLNLFLAVITLPGLIINFYNEFLKERDWPVITTYNHLEYLTIFIFITNLLPQGFWWSKLRKSFIYSFVIAIFMGVFSIFPLFGRKWLAYWALPLPNTVGPVWINYSSPEFNLIFGVIFSLFFIGFYFLIKWFLDKCGF